MTILSDFDIGDQGYQERTLDQQLHRLAAIGIALSAERRIDDLFEMIIDEACNLTNADAGTLYIVDHEDQSLKFEVVVNRSLGIKEGGKTKKSINLPNVPLFVDGAKNLENVSSFVAHTGKLINIHNVEHVDRFTFNRVKEYDKVTGYKTVSMLVIPMKDHEQKNIGVLQLINAMDGYTGLIKAFPEGIEDIVHSLASQAAVALNNARLIKGLKALLYSFIESIATAIDEKSPYTKQHIKRVVDLTMLIAHRINSSDEKPFQEVNFSEDELEELKIAAWVHDVGKVVNPEHIIDKSTKLETIIDRIELVTARFDHYRSVLEIRYLKEKQEALAAGDRKKLQDLEIGFNEHIAKVKDDLELIKKCNQSSEFMSDEDVQKIQEIGMKKFESDSKTFELLTQDEVENLCIRKGTLSPKEREIIESHAELTYKITDQLKLPAYLKNVPQIASGHHEKLNGTGYPKGLAGQEISMQSRIMAIADIFEALTAKDRPYKKPMKLSEALQVLQSLKSNGHLDPDLCDFFIESKLYCEYAKKELEDGQIDCDL